MHRSPFLAAAGALALCATVAAPAAFAAEEYPPTTPTRAAGVCVGDIPYFAYAVDFGSDSFVGAPMTITFVNPGGADFVIETVVPDVDAPAAVLWPGASADPEDWPGWELNADGIWVETTQDEGAFTRAAGGVEVRFDTNPTLATTVTYPPATEACANPENFQTTGGGGTSNPETPTTGADNPVTPTSVEGGEAVQTAATTPQTGASVALPIALGVTALGIGAGLTVMVRRRNA